jgi:transketolase
MKPSIEYLTQKSQHIRKLILEMCSKAGTGHVTSSFSCTEILVALYYGGLLRFDPKNPRWPERDRFILSKGQASVILYCVLADLGFFPVEELDHFAQADGKFGVHLQNSVPGVEITAGSLGQGINVATGLAHAAKLNRELHMVVSLLGDGECYEGAVWEAAMFASHYRLNNLVAIVDRNHLCATDFTENALQLEPLGDKWAAFGWNVVHVDGHSLEQLMAALEGFRCRKIAAPTVIIADTVKGKGVDFMCNYPLWHANAPKGEQVDAARAEINQGH